MSTVLEVRGARVHYGILPALQDVSFSLEQGECLAIIGANGAGKTSLMQFIAGALPGGGEVRLGTGLASTYQAARARAGICIIPEGRRLFPSLSVRENILIGAETRRDGPWTLPRILGLFPDLEPLLERPSTALSGGQQQMVAIARALMGNPLLLLCDEVSLGLAPKIIGSMYAALADIRKEGMSMIVVEQDLDKALSIADRLICMRQGQVSLEAAADQVNRAEVEAAYFGTNELPA